MTSTTPKGQAPIRKPHALANKQPNAKANVKRRWRPSSEYIAIMKVSARTPNAVIAFIQPCFRSPLCSPPRLHWLHPGSTKSMPVLLTDRPTRVQRTGSAVGPPRQHPPCTGRPSSKPRPPEGQDFLDDQQGQGASAR